MGTNCIRCVVSKRTGTDLLCDQCREERKQGRNGLPSSFIEKMVKDACAMEKAVEEQAIAVIWLYARDCACHIKALACEVEWLQAFSAAIRKHMAKHLDQASALTEQLTEAYRLVAEHVTKNESAQHATQQTKFPVDLRMIHWPVMVIGEKRGPNDD
jgi:hypothetical protein